MSLLQKGRNEGALVAGQEPRAPFTAPQVSRWERGPPARIVPIDFCKKLRSEPTRLSGGDRLIKEYMQEIALEGWAMDQGTMLLADEHGVSVGQGCRCHACRAGRKRSGYINAGIRIEVTRDSFPENGGGRHRVRLQEDGTGCR